MNNTIGEIIRKNRLALGFTQEQLADRVGVTMQAVSKWELGSALPDITMIIPLAGVFGVTPNELLGFNLAEVEADIRRGYDEYRRHHESGDHQAKFAAMQEALKRHPHDWITRKLWCHAYSDALDENSLPKEEFERCRGEIIKVYEDLIDHGAPDDEERSDAMSMLLGWYKAAGRLDDAFALANRFPHIGWNREIELLRLYDRGSDEFALLLQEVIRFHTVQLTHIGFRLAALNRDDATRLKLLRKYISVFETVFDDGNLGYYHGWFADRYREMSGICTRLGKPDEAAECLRLYGEHEAAYAALPNELRFTASLVDRLVQQRGEVYRTGS